MKESANPGLIRPPFVHLLAILAGWALEILHSTQLLAVPGRVAGALAIAAGIALTSWCKRTMDSAGTPLPGGLPTTAIVKTGHFAFSRNPIYVAFALIHAGAALALDSAWVLAMLAPALLLIGLVVVPREERYLEGKFGSDYLAYKASVRRWV